MAATVAARSASVFASPSFRLTKAANIRTFTVPSSASIVYNIILRAPSTSLSKSGRVFSRKSCQIRAATLQEKEEKVGVEDYFHVKTMPNTINEPREDGNSSSKEPGVVEKWVIKFEQSLNVLLTDSVIKVLDLFYQDRNYARFFVLETIARVPYFAFISVLHMYESFGWWRRADYLKVHFAESWNELHHLLIMEELGGNAFWFDRFLAQHIAIFYYFMTVFMYALSPRMAYHFSECVERHAYSTYDKFIKLQGEELKKLPAPQVAINYYMNEDLYLFDEFQTSRAPNTRRPKIGIILGLQPSISPYINSLLWPTATVQASQQAEQMSIMDRLLHRKLLPPPASLIRLRSNAADELKAFRSCLRWMGVDHSTSSTAALSWTIFFALNFAVPSISHFVLTFSPHRRPFDAALQLSLSSAAAVAFLCLSSAHQRYGLRRLLFLDELRRESPRVHAGYTAQLGRSFRILSFLVAPCLVAEFAYKIWWYLAGSRRIPFLCHPAASDSVAFALELASWTYRTAIFLLVCVLFSYLFFILFCSI